MLAKQLLIEGYTPDELLNLPLDQIEGFIFTGAPVVFKAGSANILGEFKLDSRKLTIELAQIDGGGEGVLPWLWVLIERYARLRNMSQLEWIVYATNCAKPNPKLKRVLERRGFTIQDISEYGSVYYFLEEII